MVPATVAATGGATAPLTTTGAGLTMGFTKAGAPTVATAVAASAGATGETIGAAAVVATAAWATIRLDAWTGDAAAIDTAVVDEVVEAVDFLTRLLP